ncbi:MAG TPA: ArsI/CadI family heavy metal resistance metalloenzyme [Candidatus Cybelea sp.]|jgi:catechol 2,3-dioxygenase-like lactoylglutathione lyase family enzyme|nr:ArsI/CadI family heavy metal resistance metalloenzyme [Candidatus Cybelea sp.]
MKTHLNFATTDLAASVEFYSTLLNARPKKLLVDYALFITDRPGLELALDAVDSAPRLSDDHYGVFVETVEEIERAAARLEEAGFASSLQREQTCCYANQTKVWTTDPTGRRWEVYTVHEDTGARNSPDSSCCTAQVDADARQSGAGLTLPPR